MMGDVFAGRWGGGAIRGLASLGSLVVVALILLNPASALAASIELPAGSSAADLEALKVSDYQDEFDVSRQTAEENLEAQEDGAGLVEQLEGAQGKGYAGVWFDNESGEFVVPIVDGENRSSVADQLAAAGLSGDFRTTRAASSWDQLEAAQDRVDDALLPLIEEGLVGTGLDPRTNAVFISLAAGANDSQRAQVEAAAGDENVEVEVRESQAQRVGVSEQACQFGASICDAPMRGGVNIVPDGAFRGAGCTAGFKGVGKTYGTRVVLTAGHCVYHGGTKWDSFTAAPEERKDLGPVALWSYPVHDWAAINANGTYWDKPSWPVRVTYWGVNQEFPISNESYSYTGQYVCHAGQQTGLSCGTVTAMHLTEPSEDDNGNVIGYVSNLTRFGSVCTLGGDSGGPVFTPGGVAVGIYTHSDRPKGAPACYHNGYYNEITEATDAMGVTVAPRIPPPASTWHSDNLGGPFTGAPDISSWGQNRLDLFARGTNSALYHKHWNGIGWSGWQFIGGALAGGPGAVSWGPGRIDVVARATNNSIEHWWYEGGWYSDNLGGTLTSDADISSWGPNRLDVFARGADNALWHKFWNGSWSVWQSLGGSLVSGPGAVSWGHNRIDVVARTTNNSVQHWWWDGSAWHSDNLGGTLASDIDISSWGPNRLDVFGKGTDNALWHKFWNGGGWSVWEKIGGSLASGPGAVSSENGRIDIVARQNGDDSIAHWWWAP